MPTRGQQHKNKKLHSPPPFGKRKKGWVVVVVMVVVAVMVRTGQTCQTGQDRLCRADRTELTNQNLVAPCRHHHRQVPSVGAPHVGRNPPRWLKYSQGATNPRSSIINRHRHRDVTRSLSDSVPEIPRAFTSASTRSSAEHIQGCPASLAKPAGSSSRPIGRHVNLMQVIAFCASTPSST